MAIHLNSTGVDFTAVTNGANMDYYAEYTSPSTACSGGITSSISYRVTRVGNLITWTVPSLYGTTTNVTQIVLGVALPAEFRPTQTLEFAYPTCIKGNARQGLAMFRVMSNGVILVQSSYITSTAWGTAHTSGWEYPLSASWSI
jgi:hypothetical protein